VGARLPTAPGRAFGKRLLYGLDVKEETPSDLQTRETSGFRFIPEPSGGNAEAPGEVVNVRKGVFHAPNWNESRVREV
jgi:hypothetical protein